MINKPNDPLSGVLVALTTPYDDNGEISESRLSDHIEHMITAGIHGIVPGGSTGEFTTLTLPERRTLIELVCKHVNNRIPVVAGIGALSTTDDLALAAHAASCGAAAVMVVPPFYDAVTYPQLKELMKGISDASGGLPIVYYNIPSASGLKLSPAQIAGLSDVGVKYLKDTSGDAPALTELIFGHHEQITTFNGWDTLTFYAMCAGTKGCVWGAANVIPELCVELWEAVAIKGDLKKGRELWGLIWPVCEVLERYQYAGAVKTGMELQGIKTGGLRKPFGLLEGEERAAISAVLVKAGLKVVQ